ATTPPGRGRHLRRPPSEKVPATKSERERLRALVEDYARTAGLVPPLGLPEVLAHVRAIIDGHRVNSLYRDFLAVLLNNAAWRRQVAGFPFERRLLLLPKCLRDAEGCVARIDELGLVCAGCGRCPIADLQGEAEDLGYAVMVAEGSPVVMALIESGKIDAVVGVSCLGVLERVFPYMEAGAVPGIAVPLLNDGCCDTSVDLDWVWDALHLSSATETPKLDLEGLRAQVEAWCTPEGMEELLGTPRGSAEEIARAWVAKAGKRWRPLLAASVYQTLQARLDGPVPRAVRMIALAVECFHKASLIHDDIEDGDALRYGEKTLHEEHGIPIALNAGDFLLGEGYRLIAACGAPPAETAAILRVVSEGHRSLATGQGAELAWMRAMGPLAPREVLDIFKLKTAPGFEVALAAGAIAGGAGEEVARVLARFSEAVGVAYQIRDDLEDFRGGAAELARPSLVVAWAYERADAAGKALCSRLWEGGAAARDAAGAVAALCAELRVEEEVRELLETYKAEAVRSLCGLKNAALKGFLRRIVAKIFNEVEGVGCCDEHQAGDAAGGAAGAGAAA
ncbi:MAG TPA: polyprenyl synthetase family protein, partial [Planctomycetota bacterium]|nr:polyprenyl synthetase family protein [Planctomycetota bacterium]